jgi:general secretion pathway protein D
LNIVDKNDAKTRDIPVKVSNDPDQIPNNAEIVTQIIPVRFVEAEQLVKDLASFVSSDATIVANEAGNSIVITDTQSNIRHLVEIIKAVDSSAEGETQIRVFHLSHANPTDVANELAQIFPSNNGSSGTSTAPVRFGGGPGGGGPGGFFARMMGGGGGGGGAAAGASGNNARMQKQTQVLATADLRTSSVIVTASKDLMSEIEGMMDQLDVASNRDQKVYVFHMNNGDTMQDLQVLQSMFGGTSGNSSSHGGTGTSTTGSALGTRETQNASSSGTGSTSTSGSSTGLGGGGGGGGGGRGGF